MKAQLLKEGVGDESLGVPQPLFPTASSPGAQLEKPLPLEPS